MDKKGDYKYGIILYLILGLLVLSISIYFIFNEYFTEEDGDREVCWQSVQLRALMPEYEKMGIKIAEFKSDFPLKCKTNVVEISKEDVEKIELAKKKIADAVVDCWALYGKGDYSVFPSRFFDSSVCVPCARVHLSEDAKKYMGENEININITDALDLRMTKDYTYYSYLENSGDRFSAFNVGAGMISSLGADKFMLDDAFFGRNNLLIIINRLSGAERSIVQDNELFLPGMIFAERGDLMINYGVALVGGSESFGEYVPYLFYFQSGQNPNPFEMTKHNLFHGVKLCSSWEGIPG
jgi:hypothetical protein